jgi:hypothetical protein
MIEIECYECYGEGTIIICPDDMCHGTGECIHGDGEVPCPVCDGRGFIPEEEDEND